MRKILGVFLLVLLLTCSASAGIMGNDSPAPPPAQPARAELEPTSFIQEPTTDGEMNTPVAAATFAQIVLTLLALS